MTDLLTRPASGSTRVGAPQPSIVSVAIPAAVAPAAVGLLASGAVVLVLWAISPSSSASGSRALRTAGQLWLLAHRVPLDVPGGRLGVPPLLLTLAAVLLLVRAGRRAARAAEVTSLGAGVALTGVTSITYGVVAAVLAAVSGTPAVHPDSLGALVAGVLLGAVGSGAGVLRETRPRLPVAAAGALRGGAAGMGVLLAAGALLASVALALHLPTAARVGHSVAPSLPAGVGLWLLGLTLVPTGVVWSVSFLVGPGFAVGVGTGVSPFGVEVGAVPALPLLAALPESGSAAALPLLAAVLAVVLAGVVTGLVVLRHVDAPAGWRPVRVALAAGALTGLALAALAVFASGPAGPGRLAVVGPHAWRVGLAAAGEVGAVAALTVAWRLRRTRA